MILSSVSQFTEKFLPTIVFLLVFLLPNDRFTLSKQTPPFTIVVLDIRTYPNNIAKRGYSSEP